MITSGADSVMPGAATASTGPVAVRAYSGALYPSTRRALAYSADAAAPAPPLPAPSPDINSARALSS